MVSLWEFFKTAQNIPFFSWIKLSLHPSKDNIIKKIQHKLFLRKSINIYFNVIVLNLWVRIYQTVHSLSLRICLELREFFLKNFQIWSKTCYSKVWWIRLCIKVSISRKENKNKNILRQCLRSRWWIRTQIPIGKQLMRLALTVPICRLTAELIIC